MSACRRLVLLISIIGGFIRIWLSIPNQFVIASYLAVAEHQIMFSLHSVNCKKPPTFDCIQFFFYIIHGDICKLYYWIWTLYMASRRTSFWIYIHIYIWKQATHSVGCRFINIYCTVPGGMCSLNLKFILLLGLISWTIYNIAVRAATTLCKPQANILKNCWNGMSSFWQKFYYRLHRKATSRAANDENFIKMIFPFQRSCKLNHTNIPCRPCPCVHNMLRSCVFI